jgi:hypothetical protein
MMFSIYPASLGPGRDKNEARPDGSGRASKNILI